MSKGDTIEMSSFSATFTHNLELLSDNDGARKSQVGTKQLYTNTLIFVLSARSEYLGKRL